MKWLSIRELAASFAGIALFGTVVASAVQGPFDPKSEMIFTGEKAVALLPPIVAAKGDPRSTKWSGDGKWLFLESQDVKVDAKVLAEFIASGALGKPPATSETVLTMFDAEKGSGRELVRYKSDGSQVLQTEWLPGNRNLSFLIHEPFTRDDGSAGLTLGLYVASPFSGRVSRVIRLAENEYARVVVGTSTKGAVVVVQDMEPIRPAGQPGGSPQSPSWRAIWLGVDGKLGTEIRIQGNLSTPYWTPSGEGPYFDNPVRDPETKKVVPRTYFMNFASGTVIQVATPAIGRLELAKLGFQAQFGQSSNVAETAQVSRESLWLKSDEKSEQQFALVAAEAESAELSPGGNAIYYESKGLPMIRPLMSMPKDAALNALNAAERARAISDAKQAALALLLYATDYDGTFPSNAGDWADAVNPYLKNREILDGFTYTYSGGPMSDIKNPAETEIGYKIGPGGRAVAYADGHVIWIPNGKSDQNLSALTRPCSGALLGSMPTGCQPSFSSA